jgi:starch synthase (maltosyl-transferring)
MKPNEGRKRVVIEEIQPTVNAGRYAAKRVVGDEVVVTAAIFGDGHDHLGARLLFRHSSERTWQSQHSTFRELGNDLWSAAFTVDRVGLWYFAVEAWIDHFDTWLSDLDKRLAAQQASSQDIPLALNIGANHLDTVATRARGDEKKALKAAAFELRNLAAANLPFYEGTATPGIISPEIVTLAAQYPNLPFATRSPGELPLWVDRKRAQYSTWYELFPRSASPIANEHGTLSDVEARLPEIAAMGFDVLYMPPIHPIGTAFRKGKNNSVTAEPGEVGSPWAIGAPEGGHTEILPALGNFNDFDSLLRAAKHNGMELALDIAFQCSPDHPWVKAHPAWFTQRPDGTIQYAENPPKKYQDIYPLNFESTDWRNLWDALYKVFKFWVDRGVRIFRVDNPHTKALPFWEWCITEIHTHAPDALFLAEAFTRPHVMYSLAKAGYTQSYTYFTWRNDKPSLQAYFEEICNPPVSDFFRPNVWPNTPDILHEQLQVADPAERRAIFMQRVILAATLSSNYGIYGPAYELCEWRPAKPVPPKTGSEEYLDSEKYQIRTWDLASPESIAPLITQLNRIRYENFALQSNHGLHFHTAGNSQIIAYSKTTPDTVSTILTIVNLDRTNEQNSFIDLALDKLGLPWGTNENPTVFEVEDLLTGAKYEWRGPRNYVALNTTLPAHILRIVTPPIADKA